MYKDRYLREIHGQTLFEKVDQYKIDFSWLITEAKFFPPSCAKTLNTD